MERSLGKRRLGCLGWSVAGAALAFFAARTFVGDVYRVESGSMEPTLHAGEYVFVRHGPPQPLRRFDVLALRGPEDERQVVKRLVGLPGESISLRAGDLVVDGRTLGPAEPRPEPVSLFDSRVDDLEAFFLHGTSRLDPWRQVGAGTWRLEARDVAQGTDAGLMCTREPVEDAYRDAAGALVPGVASVDDVGFAGELRWLSGAGRLRVRLGASWDTYELVLEALPDDGGNEGDVADEGGGVRASLSARAERGDVALAERTLELATGEWHRVEFRLLDGRARVELDGEVLFSAPLPQRREVDPTAAGAAPGGRCCFGGESVTAEWRALRVYRDLHWLRDGALGPGVACDLGPDDLFVLGDRAAGSRDSRVWGAVERARVLGRVEAVVWPPGRIRRLQGALPLPLAAPEAFPPEPGN